MKNAFSYYLKNGVDRVYLEVRASNRAAIALYEKCGFNCIGKRSAYYRYPTEDALVMLCELKGN